MQHPCGIVSAMEELAPRMTVTTRFTEAARVLARHVSEIGLDVPGFRSPPRIVGVNRTLRRRGDGLGGVVAVRLADRPFTAVIGDMIEGVIVLNRLQPPEADRVRSHLWRFMLAFTAECMPPRGTEAPVARVA
jgi:hypothetical protein